MSASSFKQLNHLEQAAVKALAFDKLHSLPKEQLKQHGVEIALMLPKSISSKLQTGFEHEFAPRMVADPGFRSEQTKLHHARNKVLAREIEPLIAEEQGALATRDPGFAKQLAAQRANKSRKEIS